MWVLSRIIREKEIWAQIIGELLRSENPSALPPKPAWERRHNTFFTSGFFTFKTPATLFPMNTNNTVLLPRTNLNLCYLNQEP